MAQIGGEALAPATSSLFADAKGSDELCRCARHADASHNPRNELVFAPVRTYKPAMCNVIFSPFEFKCILRLGPLGKVTGSRCFEYPRLQKQAGGKVRKRNPP